MMTGPLKYTLFLLLFLTGIPALGQPSSSITFAFRLYDNAGHRYDLRRFCEELVIENIGGGFISPCDSTNGAPFSDYDDSSGYFFIYIGSIYPPYIFSLSGRADTITMIFPHKTDLACDSLTIHNGLFLFDVDCVESAQRTFPRMSITRFCPLNDLHWEEGRWAAEVSVHKRRVTEYRGRQQQQPNLLKNSNQR